MRENTKYRTEYTNAERDFGRKDFADKMFDDQGKNVGPRLASNDSETNIYFMHALETLKQGITGEERGIFIHNVLEQTEGQELQLSCESSSSLCLEMLFDEADDLSVIIRFMKAFSENLEVACGNRFSSHVTENLLYLGLRSMQTWSTDVEAAEKNEKCSQKAESIIYIISWIHNLGEFCLAHLETCLGDISGTHVLRAVIHALGGYYTCEAVNRSKRAKERKKHFEEEYLGSEQQLKTKEAITLNAIPKFFISILKKLIKAFMKLGDVKAYAVQAETAPVIEVLLFVLSKRLPKRCQKFVTHLSSSLFNSTSDEGIPEALVHKNCSYVVEKILNSAAEDQQKDLWEKYIDPFLESLIKHSVGNFVVQRLFDVVHSKILFESMCHSLFNCFDLILETRHYGVWVSMASACNRVKAQQAQFMQHLMQCFCCLEPEDRQLYLVPLLLGFEKYDDFIRRKSLSETINMKVVLQGSLLVQAVLDFQKPLKVVKSVLNMKPEEIAFLASHNQGCFILRCFLNSVNVGEKNKDKFIQNLKPVLKTLACDRSGSLTLSRMWVLMTLKQKSVVAEELSKHDHILQKSHSGFGVSKKFGLFFYKCQNDRWNEQQQNLTKKRKISET